MRLTSKFNGIYRIFIVQRYVLVKFSWRSDQ